MELYEFSYEGNVYRYSGGESFMFGGNLYTAQAITRNEIKKDFNKDEASVEMPQHLEPAPKFRIMNPHTAVGVKILNQEGIILFMGKVGSCVFNVAKASATLKLLSMQGILKTQIPYRTYGASCSFALFGEECALNKNNYKLTLTAFTLNNSKTELTAAVLNSKPEGYFSGGYIDANGEYDYIREHSGLALKLLYPLQSGATTIIVYPGCDKTRAVCKNRFNNEQNYGGFPFIPSKNPITEGF